MSSAVSASAPVVDVARFNTEAFTAISTTKSLPTALQVMTKTNEFNPSLVIPRAPLDLSTFQIKDWIENRDHLGYVDLIQFKKNADNRTKAVYIHFKRWSTCEYAEDKRDEVNHGRFIKLYDAEERVYWKMVKSDLGRPLPLISIAPTIKWNPRDTDGPDGKELPEGADTMEGDIPNADDRKMSLVIPLVLKGYTTEHVKYVFEQTDLFETILRVDPVKLKTSHKFANTHLTFYVHGIFANTVYANYFQRYLSEMTATDARGRKTNMQFEVVHKVDARPRNHSHTNWSWMVKKSDIGMPERTQTTKTTTKTTKTTKTTQTRKDDTNSYKSALFRPKTTETKTDTTTD